MGSDTLAGHQDLSSRREQAPPAPDGTESSSFSGVCSSLWRHDPAERNSLASEDDCLALIDELFPSRSPHVPRGRGDDCALLADLPRCMALSTDMFWEDIHFRTRYFTPEEVGGKALTSAVSDLAAPGARPLAFSLALMLPPWLGKNALRAVLSGMADKADEHGIFLSGGDLSRGEKLGFSVTVWGESPCPGSPSLHRGTAKPGDAIFLVGQAGLSRVGLWALEKWGRSALATWPEACAAHLSPRPLLAAGRVLARLAQDERGEAHRMSLMDLSDGLIRDLPRLLGGLGADLCFDKSIVPGEVIAAAEAMGSRPEDLFLLGGEDYALIGSCAEEFWPRLSEAVPGTRLLGRASTRPGISRRGLPVVLEGFDHFSGHSAALSLPDGTAESAVHAVPLAGAVETPPLPLSREMKGLIAIGREAWTAGLMAGFNGNISCRVSPSSGASLPEPEGSTNSDDEPLRADACLITRSGAAKGRLTRHDFALLDMWSGKLIAGASASTESAVHLAVYAACPQSRAVLHVHPPCLLALSLLLEPEKRLALPLPEAEAYRAGLGHAPFQPPGSAKLATVTAEAAKTHPAVWMERHGLVVHGKDLSSALSLAEELEQLAKVHLSLLASSPTPQGSGGVQS